MKDYWTWTCHKCGHDDNRNNDDSCQKCGAPIRCESAGGHHWKNPEVNPYCSRGCGLHTNGTIDLSKRRPDY